MKKEEEKPKRKRRTKKEMEEERLRKNSIKEEISETMPPLPPIPPVNAPTQTIGTNGLYAPQLEALIDAALEDGILTEKEKQVLFKKAQSMGIDLDEFEVVLDARLVKVQKEAEKEETAKAQAEAQSAAPKSNKFGDIKKCPACGAMVQSFQGVCPECGYAFEGIDANSAVKELSSLLQKTSDNKQMEKIIDNYPIPMEKAALMAFITWLRPQSTDSKNPLANSYLKKYSECINKIRVSFANDKELQPLLSYYESDVKKVRNQKIIRFTLKNKWFWVGAAVIFILILILIPAPLNKNSDKTNKAMLEAIDAGDLKKAEELCRDFKKAPDYIATGRTALCRAFIQKGDLEKAEEYGDGTLKDEIFNACLKQKDYNRADKYLGVNEDYFSSPGLSDKIETIIMAMCENGDKEQATKYLNRKMTDMKNASERYYGTEKGRMKHNERVKQIKVLIASY